MSKIHDYKIFLMTLSTFYQWELQLKKIENEVIITTY